MGSSRRPRGCGLAPRLLQRASGGFEEDLGPRCIVDFLVHIGRRRFFFPVGGSAAQVGDTGGPHFLHRSMGASSAPSAGSSVRSAAMRSARRPRPAVEEGAP